MGRSSLAVVLGNVRTTPVRPGQIFGLTFHTTGEGAPAKALTKKIDPLKYLADYYSTPKPTEDFFAHYVCGWDGTLALVADEMVRAQHVGFAERETFLDGSWKKTLPQALVDRWSSAWPAYPSPAHLFPGASPNSVYVACEFIPLVDGCGPYVPARPGLKFTFAQHQTAVMLAKDFADRNQIPGGWERTSRLLGHEDLNPIQRSTKNPPGGWDPGALRADPWFDFSWIRDTIAGVSRPL